jgi:hypothetical protein
MSTPSKKDNGPGLNGPTTPSKKDSELVLSKKTTDPYLLKKTTDPDFPKKTTGPYPVDRTEHDRT